MTLEIIKDFNCYCYFYYIKQCSNNITTKTYIKNFKLTLTATKGKIQKANSKDNNVLKTIIINTKLLHFFSLKKCNDYF